jgi:uncharacterized protein YoxC
VHSKSVPPLLVISLALLSLPATAQLTEYNAASKADSIFAQSGGASGLISAWDKMRNDVRRNEKKTKSMATRVNGLRKEVAHERKKLASLDRNVNDLSKQSSLLRSQTYTVNSRINALDKSIQSIHGKFQLLEWLLLMFFTFKKWDRKPTRSHREIAAAAKETLTNSRPNPPRNLLRKNQTTITPAGSVAAHASNRRYIARKNRRLLNDMVPCGGSASALPIWMKFMSWELSEFDWTADQIMSLFELSHPPQSCNSNDDIL